MTGIEALLRWISPTLGQVLPDEFIPIAEGVGQVVAVDSINQRKINTAGIQCLQGIGFYKLESVPLRCQISCR
jgi:hypothetical protein